MDDIEVECPKCKGKFDPVQYKVDLKVQSGIKRIKELSKPARMVGVIGFVFFCLLQALNPGMEYPIFLFVGIFWLIGFLWLWKIDAYINAFSGILVNIVTGPYYDLICPLCGVRLTFKKDRVFLSKK